ncbi:hypothetical protein HK405_009177, partial [Cladochytrium tenue]
MPPSNLPGTTDATSPRDTEQQPLLAARSVSVGAGATDGVSSHTLPAAGAGSATLAKQLPARYWVHAGVLNALIISFFAVHIAAGARLRGAFFALHPLGIAVFFLATANSVLLLQYTRGTAELPSARTFHSISQPIGLLGLLTAGSVVFRIRASEGRAHFDSPHTILGPIVTTLTLVTAAVAAAVTYKPLATWIAVAHRVRVLRAHRLFASLVFSLAFVNVSGFLLEKWEVSAFGAPLRAILFTL